MKQIVGKQNNISDYVMGRITSKKSLFNRKDQILVDVDAIQCPSGYTAVITLQKETKGSSPIVSVDSIDDFNDGDVVLINKEGEIVFLFEIQSQHNAIFATERCNHRCIMCPQPPVKEEEDKTPLNLKLISLIDKNANEIGITGGEPTMIGDKLFELIKQIQKYQPKAAISILSNGVVFSNREYAFKLAACRHHDLQVDIPLFSDIAEEHNRIVGAKTFYKTVEGLYNLALAKQKVGIRIVIHKQTYRRLVQMAEYIYRNFPFATQVAFMEMETIGNAKKNIEDLWIDPYEYNEELREAVLLLNDRGMHPLVYNAQLCVLDKDIREFATQSISDWKDIYIEECEGCSLKGQCAGFFASNKDHHSSYIKKVEI